ncbi:MAG: ADP-forming succinate--CoA ligase subunit beta [bacterium]
MKIHEYQAKQLFREYGIPTPESKLAHNVEETVEVADSVIGTPCVIKAQVHSGARGKAGGIKVAKNMDEVKEYASKIIGMKISSVQTGGEEKTVHMVLVEQAVAIDKELYLSVVMDRASECITIIASNEGGMDIEEIAESMPDAIIKEDIDPRYGLSGYNIRNLIFKLNVPKSVQKDFSKIVTGVYNLFLEKDCTLVEINPLTITKEEKMLALDGKVNFDENALFRFPEIVAMRDFREEDPLEVEASKYNLSYVKLDGEVGCMVNGAGLAMATMDTVKLAGSEPANFLDVGGGASAQKIENAFKLLISDKNVKMVFINIFGGILRCDILAEGIKNAVSSLKVDIPVIVRLEGTNVEKGREILKDSGLKFEVAETLKDAVSIISANLGG